MVHTDDTHWMDRALKLAERGRGKTSPNPMVGAVIVKDGKPISEGWHRKFGEDHAEVDALKKLGFSAHGATMYVNLEPCSHYGKTPPCVDAIIRSGIKKVVIGMLDPNPLVSGKGIMKLKENGIDVKVGVMERECIELNAPFVVLHTLKRPFINAKVASSMDGKIATPSGKSRWITSFPSRVLVHRMRALHDAVMVGIGTILKDNPKLNVRHVEGRNPKVLVVDSKLRTPPDSNIFRYGSQVIIITGKNSDKNRKRTLEKSGAHVIEVEEELQGILNLRKALNMLTDMGISSVMVEGGGRLFSYIFERRLCDRLTLFLAPKLIGGRDSIGFFSTEDPRDPKDALPLKIKKIEPTGNDILIEADITDVEKLYREMVLCSQD